MAVYHSNIPKDCAKFPITLFKRVDHMEGVRHVFWNKVYVEYKIENLVNGYIYGADVIVVYDFHQLIQI